jgi:cytochrome c oxidase cbb3-type subunit III
MNEPHSPKVLDHEYDGIQEFDNPTPGWWHAIFAATIVFAVVYTFVAEFSPMYTKPEAAHAAASAKAMEALFGTTGFEPDETTLLTLMEVDNGQWIDYAKSKFAGKCASCHGANGQGVVGPNLTDDHWKNVKQVTDIFQVITNGAAAGSMPAQKNTMSKNERVVIAAYVASLRGSNPPGGLAADGEEIAPWPTPNAGGGAEGAAPTNDPGG